MQLKLIWNGGFEDRAIAALRGKSSDDPRLDRDGAVGAGPVRGRGRYSPRPAVEHKLDPYKGIIEARLEEFSRLSAKRLFEEVRAAGYTGGYVRVREYVRAKRPREPVRRW